MSAALRTKSPTTALWDQQQSIAEKKASMINMGLHVFYPEWQGSGRIFSHSFKTVTMKLYGTEEKITFPCQTCTKVEDVKQALAAATLTKPEDLRFIVKQGCSTRALLNTDEMGTNVTVRGLASFKPQRHKWPHPAGVIGAGYHGLKTLIMYVKSGNTDIVCFDRNNKVGGYCWITAANKCSKLQTELGAFHVWWGQEVMQDKCMYPTEYWETWPKKEKVLEHFQFAAENYGILPHICFRTDVRSIDIVGDKKGEHRYYSLQHTNLDSKKEDSVNVSMLWNYPGSMTRNRIIDYPGEDEFEGNIGYGMGDDCAYEHLEGSNTAILGNGAFAVENARTSLEHGANKVYIVTRRKNLASPRVPCWFVHQGPAPTPGRLVLKMLEPMYALSGMGDPWTYWAVHASADKMKVQIIQNSRFGIGDVTFVAVACGKIEYVVDTLKRCSKHTMHLTSGRKLENVTMILKALGLLGDWEVDRMHKMDHTQGQFCGGDWRRVIHLDATGMNAANFTTFSTGIGTVNIVRMYKFLFDWPHEYARMEEEGLLLQLPKNHARPEEEKPAYVYDVNYANATGVIMGAMCPRASELSATDPVYKHEMYHITHPLDRFMKECIQSWDDYQAEWRKRGCTHPYVEYPYTKEMIEGYAKEYNEALGLNISVDGPGTQMELYKEPDMPGYLDASKWATSDAAIEAVEQGVKAQSAEWWYQNSQQNVVNPNAKAGRK